MDSYKAALSNYPYQHLFICYIILFHFYVGLVYDDMRLHVVRSYTSSALISSFRLCNHLHFLSSFSPVLLFSSPSCLRSATFFLSHAHTRIDTNANVLRLGYGNEHTHTYKQTRTITNIHTYAIGILGTA